MANFKLDYNPNTQLDLSSLTKKQKPTILQSALQTAPQQSTGDGVTDGAIQGASTGSAAGPWGAAIGGVVGGISGGLKARAQRKRNIANIEAEELATKAQAEDNRSNNKRSILRGLGNQLSATLLR